MESAETPAPTPRQKATTMHFAAGQVVFAEGDRPDFVFLVSTGKVRLGRMSPGGRECLHTVMGPGEMFGEVALLDGTPRNETATAMTDVRALAWDRSQLTALVLAHPSAGDHLMRLLARRIRRASDDIADLMSASVSARVAKHLLRLAQQFGQQDSGGIRLTPDLNQQQFAHLAGTSRECVNRALAEFSEQGWIRLDGSAIVIVDSQPLAQRMDGARRHTPEPR